MLPLVALPLAFALAATPTSDGAAPVVTQRLPVSGGSIGFSDSGGTGPLVVAVPGLGDLRSSYRFLARQLVAAGFRVVTIDLRGHGASSPTFTDHRASAVGSDVLALIRHLNAGPAHVIGTSFGAAAVAWAAATEPGLVSRVVVIGPFVQQRPAKWTQQAMMGVLFAGPWRVAAWITYFDSLFVTHKPPDHAAQLALLRANLDEPGRFDALRATLAVDRNDVDPLLERIAQPVLVVMGTKDPDFDDPRAEAEQVAHRMHGTVQLVDGAGHYPHVEMPERAGPPIVSFLSRDP